MGFISLIGIIYSYVHTHKRNDTRASLALAEKATRANAVNHNKAYRLLTISFNHRRHNISAENRVSHAFYMAIAPPFIFRPLFGHHLPKRFGRGIAVECAINYPLCGEYARDIDWCTPPKQQRNVHRHLPATIQPRCPTATNNIGYRQQWWTSKRPGRYHRRH